MDTGNNRWTPCIGITQIPDTPLCCGFAAASADLEYLAGLSQNQCIIITIRICETGKMGL